MYETICDGTYYKINKVDYKLLNELALNARVPIIKLVDKLGCSSQIVTNHIKNLFKNDIIKEF